MADMIRGWFSGAPGFDRVNIPGLIVMLVGVGITFLASKFARRVPEAKREGARIIFKFSGLVICMAGFAIALY